MFPFSREHPTVKISEAAAHVAHKAGSNRGMTNAEAEFAAATAGAIAAAPWRKKIQHPNVVGGIFCWLIEFYLENKQLLHKKTQE